MSLLKKTAMSTFIPTSGHTVVMVQNCTLLMTEKNSNLYLQNVFKIVQT